LKQEGKPTKIRTRDFSLPLVSENLKSSSGERKHNKIRVKKRVHEQRKVKEK
jgi:hypothetical protein